jgi:hypothetical protein
MIELACFLTSREAGDLTGRERLYEFVLYLMYIYAVIEVVYQHSGFVSCPT